MNAKTNPECRYKEPKIIEWFVPKLHRPQALKDEGPVSINRKPAQ